MPLVSNSPPHTRKQQIRIRDSTALMPASYVELPIEKLDIVDLEYAESSTPTKRPVGRPRSKKSFTSVQSTWIKKSLNKSDTTVKTIDNDAQRMKSLKRKDAPKTKDYVSPSLKRMKFSQPGPLTSYLNRPFDRIKIDDDLKQKIIENQPILRLTAVEGLLISSLKNTSTQSKSTKACQRSSPPKVTSSSTPISRQSIQPVREPVFIAVEDDAAEQNSSSHPGDNSDTNISSSVMCRLCGVAGPNRFSLIGVRSERLNLLVHLKNYLNIEISDEENLPLHICPLCSQTIISFFKFHGRVKTTTNRLQAIVNESTTSHAQRSWESVPWYGDNILATAMATNEYLTKKHLRKLETKGKIKNMSTKFVTTNIEKLFGDIKKNGIDPDLIVEDTMPSDNEASDADDRDWLPSEPVIAKKPVQNIKILPKRIDASKLKMVETINIDDDEPINSSRPILNNSTTINTKLKAAPRLVLQSKPPAMTPKPTFNNSIPLINTSNVSTGSKTYLIPIQNFTEAELAGLNQGSPLKFALSPSGAPLLLQSTPGSNNLTVVSNQVTKASIIKGISNIPQNSIMQTTSPVDLNKILATSNAPIPIPTLSPISTTVPNISSASKKTVTISPANTSKSKSSLLHQTLTAPKTTTNTRISVSSSPTVQSKSNISLKNTLAKTTSVQSTTGKVNPTLTVGKTNTTTTTTLGKVNTPTTLSKTNTSTTLGKVNTPTTLSKTNISTTLGKVNTSTTLSKTNISTTLGKVNTPTTLSKINTPTKVNTIVTGKSNSTTTVGKTNTTLGKVNITLTPDKSKTVTTSEKTTTTATISTATISTITTPHTKTEQISDCLPLDPAEELELNTNYRAPSKDDKYTYVVRMDRNVGEQPYFILTANPVKLKSPELTKHNVGIICKDVYKAEVEKKKVQENEGNFSNIGLHCWAQHIVWFWQLKLPGDVRIYVKQSADKILQFGQRKRIDYAKKCFQVSKQICTEAINKFKNQSKSSTATTNTVVTTTNLLPKLTPKDPITTTTITTLTKSKEPVVTGNILPKLIPKDPASTNLLPKLIPKDVTPSSVSTTQQLVLIPLTNGSKTGTNSLTYVISPNSNVKLSDIMSTSTSTSNTTNILTSNSILNNLKLITPPTRTVINDEEIIEMPDFLDEESLKNVETEVMEDNEEMISIIETVENDITVSTTDDLKKSDDTNKIQLIYTDDDNDVNEGMFDMECVSEDEEHHDSSGDILQKTTCNVFTTEEVVTNTASDDVNVQIETIDFDPTTSELI